MYIFLDGAHYKVEKCMKNFLNRQVGFYGYIGSNIWVFK